MFPDGFKGYIYRYIEYLETNTSESSYKLRDVKPLMLLNMSSIFLTPFITLAYPKGSPCLKFIHFCLRSFTNGRLGLKTHASLIVLACCLCACARTQIST